MIDWDQVVLVPNFEIFGEPATYLPAGGTAFLLRCKSARAR